MKQRTRYIGIICIMILFILCLWLVESYAGSYPKLPVYKSEDGTFGIIENNTDVPLHVFVCVWQSKNLGVSTTAPCDRSLVLNKTDYALDEGRLRIAPSGMKKLAHMQHVFMKPGQKARITGCGQGNSTNWMCRMEHYPMYFTDGQWNSFFQALRHFAN